MGQHEVLKWLTARRKMCDDSFRTYSQVHLGMRRDGVSVSYRSVWWSITCLFDQGKLEARAVGGILHRKWLFRAKVSSSVQTIHRKGVDNIYRKARKKSPAPPPRAASEAR